MKLARVLLGLLLSSAGALALAACGSTAARESAQPAAQGAGASGGASARKPIAPPPPWPTTFRTQTLLVAQDIVVEGPPGLIDHSAGAQQPGAIEYKTETTPDGLRQTWTVIPGSQAQARGQLDGFTLVALRSLVILERLGGDLTLRAAGDVYWHEDASGKEGRGASFAKSSAEAPR